MLNNIELPYLLYIVVLLPQKWFFWAILKDFEFTINLLFLIIEGQGTYESCYGFWQFKNCGILIFCDS